jgi:hypothetical protein
MLLPDSVVALVVLAILLMVVTARGFYLWLLEFLMMSRPASTAALLLVVVGLYWKKYVYSALAFAVLAVFLLKDLWQKYPSADVRREFQERQRDLARFDPNTSVDLQWANGTVTHDKPDLYFQSGQPKLLIFPPSEETLHEMCG